MSRDGAGAAASFFSSRWGLVLATLGMAVGTGNIWRFPRVAASNGGGSFLVAWVVFLVLWSVPLMIVEFSFGKRSRRGTVGAFAALAGRGNAWMGGWVALCALGIMFYYSVVAGWCLRYLAAAVTGELARRDPAAVWQGFAGSPAAVVTHLTALGLAFSVVWFGVRGIERVTTVLIPSLAVLVIVLAVRAVTLPGAEAGLAFLFTPDWAALGQPRIWLEALTQNAWDTGAGWGLILTYAIYMRVREDVPLNAFLIGFGNNSMSLLAGIMVLCTIFAIDPGAQAQIVGAGNEGLTFVWMPQLFARMPGGAAFMVLFFLALSVAALTSLVSMLELATRVLMDFGAERRRALAWVGAAGFAFGLPSALSMPVFQNQDWVWGLGLILSGLFFAVATVIFGADRLRREVVNAPGVDLPVGRWWTLVVAVLVPVEAVALLAWWFWLASKEEGWLAPWSTFNVGTVLVQWGVALAALGLANRWLARSVDGPVGPAARDVAPDPAGEGAA
ncbi:MAG TPA: sodium-dependent transporter [Thermoanaerobaculia bacterium]|nr:sodium-dependent transporter [Thermoanaerobaculia bacterium]